MQLILQVLNKDPDWRVDHNATIYNNPRIWRANFIEYGERDTLGITVIGECMDEGFVCSEDNHWHLFNAVLSNAMKPHAVAWVYAVRDFDKRRARLVGKDEFLKEATFLADLRY